MTYRSILPSRLLAVFQISYPLGSLWDPHDAGLSVSPPPPNSRYPITLFMLVLKTCTCRPPKDFLKRKVLVYGVCSGDFPHNHVREDSFPCLRDGLWEFHGLYNDIWIVWLSIPLMSGIGTSNKPIHCSTAESPFFQKLLSWLKHSMPIASASSPIPWSFQVYFTSFSSRLCTSYSRLRLHPHSSSLSLHCRLIPSAIVKEAVLFM